MINQIKNEQLKKIKDYGNELKDYYDNGIDIEILKRNVYYKTKLTELNSKIINAKYEEHQMPSVSCPKQIHHPLHPAQKEAYDRWNINQKLYENQISESKNLN